MNDPGSIPVAPTTDPSLEPESSACGQQVASTQKLHCTSGSIDCRVGDQFTEPTGCRWKIVSFSDDRTYSPSSIGGTPTVYAKCLGEFPAYFAQWREADGTLGFCGDSVAEMILRPVSP